MEQKNGEIILFGYGAFIAEESAGIAHLDKLMRDPYTKIADVRLKPYSPDFIIWNGGMLKNRYGYDATGKSRYVHIEELGNLNYRKEDREKGFALQDKEIGLSRLILALSFGWRLVVLCGCKYYDSCHRKLVAQLLLSELPNTKITHVELVERETPDNVASRPVDAPIEQVALFEVPTTYQHWDR